MLKWALLQCLWSYLVELLMNSLWLSSFLVLHWYMILFLSGVVSMIILLAWSIWPSYLDIQSLPMIMSKPCRSSTNKSLGKLWVSIPKVMFWHIVFAGVFPSVELTLMGLLSPWLGILFLRFFIWATEVPQTKSSLRTVLVWQILSFILHSLFYKFLSGSFSWKSGHLSLVTLDNVLSGWLVNLPCWRFEKKLSYVALTC